MAKQSADGEGAMSRRGSEQMAREPYHGETAGGWRGILVSPATDPCAHKRHELVGKRRSIGRVFNHGVKVELDSAV
jgi:hypothetical protein